MSESESAEGLAGDFGVILDTEFIVTRIDQPTEADSSNPSPPVSTEPEGFFYD